MLRAFQWYVACYLNTHISWLFQTFNGQESNWHFDSRPFFWPYLCFRYSNRSCKPILGIDTLGDFQWYKKKNHLMSFDSWNTSLNIQDSIGIPTPKWTQVDSFPHTFGSANVTLKLHSRPKHFHALALVMSSKLGLW